MVLGKEAGLPLHTKTSCLPRLLKAGDLLVLNDTQVVPARLWANKPSGGKVEVLLLSPANPVKILPDGSEVHQALTRTSRPLRAGQKLYLQDDPSRELMILERGERGRTLITLPESGIGLARESGQAPLPPYIKRPAGPRESDKDRYQTVYATKPGAVAAPTAGLHLSRELLAALGKRGVNTARVTLHVGYGTFAEPDPADLAAGRLHAEWVEITEEACQAVARTKAAGGRVIAVGTTSCRSLEWRVGPGGAPRAGAGWCDILIQPGHKFKVVDALLTNFHLPKTTLLMLVAALAGRERLLAAYQEAVERLYRFYSFGDAMLVI